MNDIPKLWLAATDDHPGEGLGAIAALRRLLGHLEELHVERARSQGWVLAGYRRRTERNQADSSPQTRQEVREVLALLGVEPVAVKGQLLNSIERAV
jgi:hypothetical protein